MQTFINADHVKISVIEKS